MPAAARRAPARTKAFTARRRVRTRPRAAVAERPEVAAWRAGGAGAGAVPAGPVGRRQAGTVPDGLVVTDGLVRHDGSCPPTGPCSSCRTRPSRSRSRTPRRTWRLAAGTLHTADRTEPPSASSLRDWHDRTDPPVSQPTEADPAAAVNSHSARSRHPNVCAGATEAPARMRSSGPRGSARDARLRPGDARPACVRAGALRFLRVQRPGPRLPGPGSVDPHARRARVTGHAPVGAPGAHRHGRGPVARCGQRTSPTPCGSLLATARGRAGSRARSPRRSGPCRRSS